MLLRLTRSTAMVLMVALICGAQTQSQPEVVSPLGAKFYSQPDEKSVVAEAEKKLAADPRNIELILALGRAQATVWRYRDALATYTRGIEMDPNNAMLYRHRGHRYITTRQFDKAIADMQHAAKLNDKNYDIAYHLGLACYLKGKFKEAAAAYEKAFAVSEKDDSRIAASDWLYMSYRRAGDKTKAARALDRITPDMKVEENKSYFDRLMLYKGLKKEAEILNDKMTDLEIATVGYGIANWYLYNGDKAKAKELFQRITSGKYWPAFGFIAAETELTRMR
ncbi:MAG TPA: tetratricopeptide repeat protein [Blastocatellia bacterium]|nr:tetratricopeptide repeat protein [Blastocatellia bacterium]